MPKTKDHEVLVFVYGTLRHGGSNHFRMEGGALVSPATVQGSLYRIDWYPALILNAKAPTVLGEVYRMPANCLAHLDAYEGPEYHRLQATATTPDGLELQVWIWEWKESIAHLPIIESGDWLKES